MMLPQRFNFFSPPALAPGGTTLAGTTVRIALDRTWPIEEILLVFQITAGAGTLTFTTDGLLGLLKRVNLSINDGKQPRSIVDCSGIGLLEYAQQVGLNLDHATLQLVSEHTKATASVVASTVYRLTYRIPMVHPQLTEPLRTRALLDVNHHPQDPVLTLDFSTLAEMYSAGTAITGLVGEIVLIRRAITADQDNAIVAAGGFIPFDLIETPFTIGPSTAGEQRWPIPSPGYYTGILMRLYKAAATVVRDDISETTTAGSETRWRLESGGVVLRDWRLKHLQTLNDYSRPANSAHPTYSPFVGGSPAVTGGLAATTGYRPPSSVYLDFLSDSLGDDANELGSLLDCNLPVNQGLKMEIIASVASIATYSGALKLLGHRFFGDLNRWRAYKI
jgi:hypothetical protein